MTAKWKESPPPKPRPEPADPILPTLSAGDHKEDLIDMTAMVDIVFFLLIFFLFTSIQSLQAVMNMPTPESQAGGAGSTRTVVDYEKDPEFLTLRIEDDDSYLVDEVQAIGEQDLRIKLRAAQNDHPDVRRIMIIGDADASHGAAVIAFDACADAGVADLSFAVQEKAGE